MVKPNSSKPPPLSYAEGPRLERAIRSLPDTQRNDFVDTLRKHLSAPSISSLQRRGQFLYVTVAEGKKESVGVYDFGQVPRAQSCLTALTDYLRSERAPVRVLMPSSPPAA
ncbi:MAG TPA: hypothetical protein PLX06_05560 [Fimbriimonadaceae bacterium]|nr:hypothetical protein [Fimbriimonadaceae bacterium]